MLYVFIFFVCALIWGKADKIEAETVWRGKDPNIEIRIIFLPLCSLMSGSSLLAALHSSVMFSLINNYNLFAFFESLSLSIFDKENL